MKYLLPTICLAGLLQACALPNGSSTTPVAEAPVSRAEQVLRSSIPAGSKIIPAQSLIIGSGENWVGRAVFTKKDRSATVEISDVNMMNGSVTVVLTVTPIEASLQPPKQP